MTSITGNTHLPLLRTLDSAASGAVNAPQDTAATGTAQRTGQPPAPTLSQAGGAGTASHSRPNLEGLSYGAILSDTSRGQNIGNVVSRLMTLLTEVLAELKKAANDGRLAESQNALKTGIAAADDMLAAADKAFTSAMVSGGVKILSAGIQMGSAMSAQSQMNDLAKVETSTAESLGMDKGDTELDDLRAPKSAPDTNLQAEAQFQKELQLKQIAQNGAKWDAIATIVSTGGDMIGKGLQFEADKLQAESQKKKAYADYCQSKSGAEADFKKVAGDAEKSAIALMRAMSQAQGDANSAIYNV